MRPIQFRTAALKETQAITASLIERDAQMLEAFGRWQPVSNPARPDHPPHLQSPYPSPTTRAKASLVARRWWKVMARPAK